MKANYHYEYYWRCVDLCNGGRKVGNFKTLFDAKFFRPTSGLWKLKKTRVYN